MPLKLGSSISLPNHNNMAPTETWSMTKTHTLHSALDHEPVDLHHPAVKPEDLRQFQAVLLSPAASGNGFESRTAPFREKVASASVQEIARRKRKKEGIFHCCFCPATFTAKHNLINHENSHKGIKSFQCAFCGSKFGHSRSKIRHERNCSCPAILPAILPTSHRQNCIYSLNQPIPQRMQPKQSHPKDAQCECERLTGPNTSRALPMR